MDANGLRFWQVADAGGFGIGGAAEGLHWRADTSLLRLDRQQRTPDLAEDKIFARARASAPSPVSDPGGSFAWWDEDAGTLRTAGFGPGSVPLALPPDSPPGVPTPTDLAFGDDDVLYVARNDGVVMIDRRDRWAPARVDLKNFHAHRLAPAPGGGAWVLDRSSGELALLRGMPLRSGGIRPDIGEVFRPVEPNPRAPAMRRIRAARLPANVEPIAIAGSKSGRVAVLGWIDGEDAVLFTLEDRQLVRRFALEGLRTPYGLAWEGEDRVAVLASDGAAPARQAFVYELDVPPGEDATARPTGEIHRLIDPWPTNFCNRLTEVPEFLVAGEGAPAPEARRLLRALSRATYARSGRVTIGPFDAGKAGNIWHRLYIEASVPEHGGIRIWMHADDRGGEPPAPGEADAPPWSLHFVGDAAHEEYPQAAQASWCDERSELPFHPGLSSCPPVPGRSGLFTALVQRPDSRVRRLSGRWLWIHLELVGDSQVSPELAALRVHGDRFSWRDRYLPSFLQEPVSGADGDMEGPATRHDFLDRFLGLFEGPLTQIETKVAGSWLLTDPAASPDPALPWLGSWIGIEAERGEAPEGLRERLRAAPWTARLHGTSGGLMAALELATGGKLVVGGGIDLDHEVPRPGQLALASFEDRVIRSLVLGISDPRGGQHPAILVGGSVTRGEIVVIEGWRLRRTFATILGADLADEDDPLTLGLSVSGNSYVGDTLILGDQARHEVMALFSAELPQSAADRAAVADFFERLAHRVLVLVRETPRTADRERLRQIAEAAAPAHVEVTLATARQPLIVAVASLVGVDSFLLPELPPRTARIGRTALGAGDRVAGSGRLDARADGPVNPPPVAVADGPAEVLAGRAFLLSAARSEAARGRSVARHIWTRL
jgi:phage tail-like protein